MCQETRKIIYEVDETYDGMKVKNYLKKKGHSHAIITQLKNNDGLFINGEHARTVDLLHGGDIITVYLRDTADIIPNALLNADIVYDDEDIAVFNKPVEMPVHCSKMHDIDTLENLFAARFPGVRFRPVSRLDKNTTGLVIIAKNKLAASRLMSDPKYKPSKLYYAIAEGDAGELLGDEGEIIAPIGREDEDYIRRSVRPDGLFAHTKYRILNRTADSCFLEISIMTGRTHQIRVHMSYTGHPLLGDKLYGGNTRYINRHALHCGKITFRHPVTEEILQLEAPLPEDMKSLIVG